MILYFITIFLYFFYRLYLQKNHKFNIKNLKKGEKNAKKFC